MRKNINMQLRLKIVEVYGTQEICALKTDIPESIISKIVRQTRQPTPDQKRKLAICLKVPIAQLFPDEVSPTKG